ncbi:MAG: hypothetical protein AB7S26_00140 [Sandaracinaceae bacterium]
MRRISGPLLGALACLILASGCKVTQDDIDYWTGTIKGPGKIVAVLLADKYEDDLRVYAGIALVRMEPREDVDGVSELQAAVRRLDEETRARLVGMMIPDLIRIMRGEDAPQAGGAEGEAVPPRQVRAKDAAFLLIPYANEENRQQLTEAVVDWFVVDFNGRSLSGNYSAEQVVRQLGAPAASRLVNALNARLPQQALVKLAELISSLGDRATKERAATRLVEIEREMEGAEFTAWLSDRLRAQAESQGTQIDESRLALAANLNRENFITLGALPSMKHLNDQPVIQDRLLEIANATTGENVTAPQLEDRRVKALQAMEGGVRAEQVDTLLAIALNNQSPTAVRDYAFDRIADSRAASAVPALWPTFTDTEDWRMRWRVGSLILTLGGNAVVQEFFTRLNDPAYAREELHGYGERLSQLRPPPAEFMNAQLRSPDWYRRCIALYYWERRGEEADIARIRALSSDAAATNGEHWEEWNTVGKVATAVADAIQERLHPTDGQPAAPAEGGAEGGGAADGAAEGGGEGSGG